jgi:hypothetical protein
VYESTPLPVFGKPSEFLNVGCSRILFECFQFGNYFLCSKKIISAFKRTPRHDLSADRLDKEPEHIFELSFLGHPAPGCPQMPSSDCRPGSPGGHFRCTESVLQAQLNGCLAAQGIRWDTAGLLASTTLKCTGAASEPLKTATTGDTTVVLAADFYRQGDGNEESFTAKMVVSENDLAPDIAGVQTVWIQGVGCGTGIANFN